MSNPMASDDYPVKKYVLTGTMQIWVKKKNVNLHSTSEAHVVSASTKRRKQRRCVWILNIAKKPQGLH